ncbi:MAG: toll/interleukin-1 receptor domain-containing protein, partial [Pseudomonadota bacterium]
MADGERFTAEERAALEGRRYDAFISYPHKVEPEYWDGPATQLARRLGAASYAVWWDRSLLGGDVWPREIEVSAERSRKIVALITRDALASDWCRREIEIGLRLGSLIPVLLEKDLALPDWLGPRMAEIHHVPAWGRDNWIDAVIAALGAPMAPPKPAARGDVAVAMGGLALAPAELVGRDDALARLDRAWTGGDRVIALHALGGAGKSALAAAWLERLVAGATDALAADPPSRVYCWSAYSQGSGVDRTATADGFLEDALAWFGDPDARDADGRETPPRDARDRARRLAKALLKERALLILDGLEPLQQPPVVDRGRLKDKGLAELLRGVAASRPGGDGVGSMILATSRQPFPELDGFRDGVSDVPLDRLSVE